MPVTDFDEVAGGGAEAVLGTPIALDLGGPAVRDIRKNATGQYLIVRVPRTTAVPAPPDGDGAGHHCGAAPPAYGGGGWGPWAGAPAASARTGPRSSVRMRRST
ncbi:hypothetical protein QFZ58_005507 [Streptomyces sp. B1I3]|nr:hypothetical protein [Streptomyces sp. B1I3]